MDKSNKFKSIYERAEITRWIVVYGTSEGVSGFALKECVMMLQCVNQYVVEVKKASDLEKKDCTNHLFIIGTVEDNHLLKELDCCEFDSPESYRIECRNSLWNPERRMICVCGATPAGCLYGVEHFNAEYLGTKYLGDMPDEFRCDPENIPDTLIEETPVIRDRGIWTWGYPIYDYQGFIDNMARLRMNTLIVWNDYAPVNFSDVIAYAGQRAVKVIPGFHWGWGMKLDLSSPEVVAEIKKHVCDTYEREYAGLEHAGIYFQTLTETTETNLDAVSRTKLVCDLVNEIGEELLKRYPDLKIYFGLHAVSVLDDYKFLEHLDSRISIIWEDAGTIPYCIDAVPELSQASRGWKLPIDTIDKTIEYSQKISRLRNCKEFKIVAKGFPNIRWEEFENHKPYVIGAQTPDAVRRKLNDRMSLWNHSNSLWLKNYPEALRFFTEVLSVGSAETMVTALIEDCMFEAGIQDGAALLAAIMWNPCRDKDYYMSFVANDYYRRLKLC